MALINCPECGKEISDKAVSCPSCGCPVCNETNDTLEEMDNRVILISDENIKGYWSVGRLVIGVISIVLFVLVSLQSCAAGIYNTFQATGETSGSRGFFLAFSMLIAGIIGICTRNSKEKTGAIVSMLFYWIGAFFTIGVGRVYADLPIWGIISFGFGVVYLVVVFKTKAIDKYEDDEKETENNNSLSDVIITVLSILLFYPVGIFIMWYSKTFNKTIRIIITCFFVLATVIYFFK